MDGIVREKGGEEERGVSGECVALVMCVCVTQQQQNTDFFFLW